ncbi:MAG: GNAT family N-acetyltransferase [Polaromonas sp.]|uniref:GNAT family N-acetyltransferase n=1 Tax=Polaromonas sp. TaxID=1869339 RepID=UPI003267E84A
MSARPSRCGQRIGEKLLALVEAIALKRGACKLTLESLQGNVGAIKLYERIGLGAARPPRWG